MDTTFCPVCGARNPEDTLRCEACGVDLLGGGSAESRPAPPLRWAVVGGAFAAGAALLALSHLVEPLARFSFRMSAGGEGLVSQDSLGRVWWSALICFAAGAGAALLSRRRVLREVALAGAGLLLVQLFLWAKMLSFGLGALLSGSLYIYRSNFIFSLPSAVFSLFGAFSILGGALAGAALGQLLLEQLSGKAACPSCAERLSIRPRPLVCPHCRSALARGRVRWGWVWLGVALTAALFSAALHFLGPRLGFYYNCGLEDRGERCLEARVALRQAGADSPWGLIQDTRDEAGFFVLFHSWKYTLYLALCFMVMPFLLGWRLKRGALATAGAVVPLGWVAATACAFFLFDFAGFEGAFLYSLRFHVLAFFAWGLAGVIGAGLGHRLGYSPAAAMMEALEK